MAVAGDTASDVKLRLRRQMKERRDRISKTDPGICDEKIASLLKETDIYKDSGTVFIYVSMPGEVDTRSLISEMLSEGKIVSVPRCGGDGIMDAYVIDSLSQLEYGKFGIPEPVKGCARINPEEIDLCIIPCLACDESGDRLGSGGGYYDRYLARTCAAKAVLCREAFILKDIPHEPYDILMDFIVTEKGVKFAKV